MHRCTQCGLKVKNAENYRRHIKVCNGEGTHTQKRSGPRTCEYCSKIFHSRGNYRRHVVHCKRVANVDLQAEYDSGLSVAQICKKYNIGRKFVDNILTNKRGRYSGAAIRKAEEPEKFFFGGTKRRSKGETVFKKMLEEFGLASKYRIEEQHHLFGYRLDFAFTDIKLDVEIDGMQHYTKAKIKKHDIRREKDLISLGWAVYRIASKDFLARPRVVFSIFTQYLLQHNTAQIIRYNGQVIDGDRVWAEKREKRILKSGIDFSKPGWGIKLGKLLSISSSSANRWVAANMPKFYKEECRTPRKDYENRQRRDSTF